MKNTTINKYYEFLKKQKNERFQMLQSIMITTHEELVHELREKGWIQKGKGNVTETMVNSNIFKSEFVKNYKGENVILKIQINFNEDYSESAYKEIKIVGSKPIPERYWWKGGSGSPLDFEERNKESGDGRFLLENQLDLIERVYNS